MLLEQIPGYKEALAAAQRKQDELRDLAFLADIIEIVPGVASRQLTPRHLLLLNACGSPFIRGGDLLAEHVAQILWILAPAFAPGGTAARDAFIADLAHLPLPDDFDPAAAIDDYLDGVFIDRPARARAASGLPPITSFVAALIDEFAFEYGWSRNEILDEPLAAIFQYQRRIFRRHNPRAPQFNSLTDRVNREFMGRQRDSAVPPEVAAKRCKTASKRCKKGRRVKP